MKSRSKPTIQVQMRDGRLLPVTRYDAEELEQFKNGQIFDVKYTSKRSDPHHKLYWSILNQVVLTTGSWATPSHLHNEIKFLTGYYKPVVNERTGGVFYVVDSISFSQMDQKEFSAFFESSMEVLSEKLGVDPMELLK